MLAQAIRATCSLPVLPLLSVKTNWIAIEGVFCSGKSTLVGDVALAKPELQVIGDVARVVIERGLAWRGPAGESVKLTDILNTQRFENTVFREKWTSHIEADPDVPHLLDYGIPGLLAFAKSDNLDTSLYESRAGLFRYEKVLILEPLPYVADNARAWDLYKRRKIYESIAPIYESYDYKPIFVPALPRIERRDYVLKIINAG